MTYVINDLNGKEIIGKFYEKELQINFKKLRTKKVIKKKKEINYMSNGKVMIILLTVGLIKKALRNKHIKMNQYFPKPGDNNVEVDLSNYVKNSWFKKCNRNWYF